ncbi:hypothetical protein EJ066_00195 [Mesorhizobium sp. M9A.F.Ca.ET.002.03.1.2]|nr:type II toxin-antitoxin system ParD family antitoxin [Mesorhizobium sp. M9A.F.Ca.ET.002.03.1.2]AZN95851.1 hypothetical protein EJ066_00195 [Mesorhizobium sp. M9A.F.Ca.ET.002.03.1.2]
MKATSRDGLCTAIDEGDKSGEPEPFDVEAFLKAKRRQRDFR